MRTEHPDSEGPAYSGSFATTHWSVVLAAGQIERCWALALLDHALQRLTQEFQEAGKGALFQRLEDFLVTGQAEARYPDAAADLGMSVGAVKKAAQRMRQRYYELFREEIAHTVGHPGEIEDELRYLCEIIAS